MKLKEFNYNGFSDDNFIDSHNPDGSKKPWPHKRKEEDPKTKEFENELKDKEGKLKALEIKISKTKNIKQKMAIQDKAHRLRLELKTIREKLSFISV